MFASEIPIRGIDAIGILFMLSTAAVLLHPKIRDAETWRATVTPLASIIGSGFLIVAPLLAHVAGSYATIAMLAVVLIAFWVGSAIRYNIQGESLLIFSPDLVWARQVEKISDVMLAVAYVISVAFYIRLLAAFALDSFGASTPSASDLLASAILLFIAFYGYFFGLRGLERLEEYSVTIKLAIITSLLIWLLHHDVSHGYSLAGIQADEATLWDKLRVLAGMLLVVQGFETSKYLGSAYSHDMRIQTMRRAQWIAAFIYVGFVALILPLTISLPQGELSETALIELIQTVSPILGVLLVVAAILSQFSAAIADTLGAGGIVSQESNNSIDERKIYPIISVGAVVLIWTTNIFELVTIASRAFALFYFLQALLAARHAWRFETGHSRPLIITRHMALAAVMLAVVIFAKAAEA
ncbi:MAG: hypothetical protein ACI9ON_001389 [Limisphaerales bacterium]